MLVHAAGESAAHGDVPVGTRAVVLSCPDEAVLAATADRLEAGGQKVFRIVESEGLYAGQLLALGLPLVRGKMKLLRGLPLLK